MKKIFAMTLCLVLLVGTLSINGLASSEDAIQPRYTTISTLMCNLTISGDGCTTDYASSATHSSMLTNNLTMELQRYTGGEWKTIKTWTGSGVGEAVLSENWYVVSGYTYRVKATATIYNSSLIILETAEFYSQEVYY